MSKEYWLITLGLCAWLIIVRGVIRFANSKTATKLNPTLLAAIGIPFFASLLVAIPSFVVALIYPLFILGGAYDYPFAIIIAGIILAGFVFVFGGIASIGSHLPSGGPGILDRFFDWYIGTKTL